LRDFFGRHDRERFEIHAYSLVDLEDDLTREIRSDCDHFTVVAYESPAAIARRIRADGIDILVDLAGATTFAKPEILAARPAPVQVLYLGYPVSSGASFIDYLVADSQLIPEDAEADYSETVIRLPSHFLAAGWPRPDADFKRSCSGLPPTGPVLACFNAHYKIDPTVFDSWMRILLRVPDAVLWLGEEPGPSTRNLRKQAERRDVDPARLVFAPRVPLEDFIGRFSLCDLFLDTFSYSAGATGMCCLLGGAPLLTRPGATFASRMGASLCAAAGLSELIAASTEDYENLAVDLISDQQRLSSLRQRLEEARTTAPLFDAPAFTASLERAYDEIWSKWRQGSG
jgi:predicted O-linked N-acetylglucosamine transferase (SPINDLY family)